MALFLGLITVLPAAGRYDAFLARRRPPSAAVRRAMQYSGNVVVICRVRAARGRVVKTPYREIGARNAAAHRRRAMAAALVDLALYNCICAAAWQWLMKSANEKRCKS